MVVLSRVQEALLAGLEEERACRVTSGSTLSALQTICASSDEPYGTLHWLQAKPSFSFPVERVAADDFSPGSLTGTCWELGYSLD